MDNQATTNTKKLKKGPLGPISYFDFFGKKMSLNNIANLYGLNRNTLQRAYKLTSNIDESVSLCVSGAMGANGWTMPNLVENYNVQKDTESIDKLKNFAYDSFPVTSYKNNDHTFLNNSIDPIEEVESRVINEELNAKLIKTMKPGLKERDQKIVRMYYGLEDGRSHTYEDIGKLFGITKERVREIIEYTLHKLRHPARAKQIVDFYEM